MKERTQFILGLVAAAALYLGALTVMQVTAQQPASTFSIPRPGAVIALDVNNPGWLPPGSLWICSSNMQIWCQTNDWNTNLAVVYSNVIPVCYSNCNYGNTNALYTNIVMNWYTGNVAKAAWVSNVAFGTVPAPLK